MLKKIFKPIKSLLSSRLLIIVPMILIQLVLTFVILTRLAEFYFVIDFLFSFISVAVVAHVLSQKLNSAYKISWIIIILALPVVGGVLFLLLGGTGPKSKLLKKITEVELQSRGVLVRNQELYDRVKNENIPAFKQANYLYNTVGLTMYENTDTYFLPTGEEFFEDLIVKLREAKHFIFIEIFILQPGIMWDTILAVLKEKAAKGLDIRLIHDDMGSLFTLPHNYHMEMKNYGIKCYAFNKFSASMSLKHNNRDHRKIIIIDGQTCYTGGCNLADEYINAFVKFGRWKDTMIRITGEGAETFTLMFLQNWEVLSGQNTHDRSVYKIFRPHYFHKEDFLGKGYVIPYLDSPTDDDNTGEMVYINMICGAKDYVYICTPYFVIGEELFTIIKTAAKSGVDVRIITPHIEDKFYVHLATQSYYQGLLDAGVKIYEYKPGFIHSKTVVVDDKIATVGTVNFDYRSLYLHFECGIWMYETKAVLQIKEDFFKTQGESIAYTQKDEDRVGLLERGARLIMKAFSPLM